MSNISKILRYAKATAQVLWDFILEEISICKYNSKLEKTEKYIAWELEMYDLAQKFQIDFFKALQKRPELTKKFFNLKKISAKDFSDTIVSITYALNVEQWKQEPLTEGALRSVEFKKMESRGTHFEGRIRYNLNFVKFWPLRTSKRMMRLVIHEYVHVLQYTSIYNTNSKLSNELFDIIHWLQNTRSNSDHFERWSSPKEREAYKISDIATRGNIRKRFNDWSLKNSGHEVV
jgi:hypothetical protein